MESLTKKDRAELPLEVMDVTPPWGRVVAKRGLGEGYAYAAVGVLLLGLLVLARRR